MHGVHTMHCRLLEDILNLQTFLVTSLLTLLMVYCMSLFSMTGARMQLLTRPHSIGCENKRHRNITMTLSLKLWSCMLWRTNEIGGF